MPERTAYVDGLLLLGRRELSVKQLRARLLDREHSREDADQAIARLLDEKALDDARVAAAYVRTALALKGRGRLRIRRELTAMGIDQDVAGAALAEAFGSVDERALITKAMQKKLRGKTIATPAEYSRMFQYLMRQGYSPSMVTAVLRAARRTRHEE